MIVTEFLATLGLDVNAASFTKGVASFELIRRASSLFFDQVVKLTKAIPEMISEVTQTSDMLDETAQKTGIATTALQELGYAASFSGISTEGMAQSLGFLAKNMVAASKGSKEAKDAFKDIDFQNADGTLKATDEVLASIADRFATMPDGAEKTALAMKLFGRAGKDMIPFLNAGSKGIAALRKEAEELGVVLDEDLIKQGVELADTQDKLSAAWKGIRYQIGSALLPDVLELSKGMLEWWKTNKDLVKTKVAEWLERIKYWGSQVWDVIKGLYPLFQGLLDFLKSDFGTGVAGVIAVIMSPWLRWAGVISAIMLLLEDFIGWLSGKESAFGDLVGSSGDEFFDALFSPPQDGDPWWIVMLKTFADIASDLPAAWDHAIAWWRELFQSFFDWLAAKWQAVKDGINDVVGFVVGDPNDSFQGRVQKATGQQVTGPGVVNLGNALGNSFQGQPQVIQGTVKEINVYAAPGQNPMDIATEVKKEVGNKIADTFAHAFVSIVKGKRS